METSELLIIGKEILDKIERTARKTKQLESRISDLEYDLLQVRTKFVHLEGAMVDQVLLEGTTNGNN